MQTRTSGGPTADAGTTKARTADAAVTQPALKVEGLIKVYETKGREQRYGRERAVNDVTIEIPQGAFFTLLGPSGCGKTTLAALRRRPGDGRPPG